MSNTSEVDESDPCPHCGEDVPASASYCPACGQLIDEDAEDDRPWDHPGEPVRRDAEPHRGALILTLGILSLVSFPLVCCGGALGAPFSAGGLALGIAAWVMGNRDLKKIQAKVMDPGGRGSTQGGKVCGIVGTALSSVGLVIGLVQAAFFSFMMFNASKGKPVIPPPPPPQVVPAPSENPEEGKLLLRLKDYLASHRPGTNESSYCYVKRYSRLPVV